VEADGASHPAAIGDQACADRRLPAAEPDQGLYRCRTFRRRPSGSRS
jgi:hypothetical protein